MKRLAFILMLLLASVGQGATLYWYGGDGNWSDYTNHWSNNSGNVPASPAAAAPTATDNVVFDSASDTGSAYTVTVNATASCANMTWGAQDQTPTLAGTAALNVAGSLTLVAGMTCSYSGILSFRATSGTKTITTNAVSLLCSLTLNGAGGTFQLGDNLTLAGGSKSLTLTAGTLDANGMTVTITKSFNVSGPFNGTSGFYDLTVTAPNETSAVLVLNNNISVAHTLTINGFAATTRVVVRPAMSNLGDTRAVSATSYSFSNVDLEDFKAFNYTSIRKVVCMGDSITDYYEPYLINPVQRYSGPECTLVDAGTAGNSTTQMLARFTTDVTDVVGAQYVVILGGINDITSGVAAAAIESNLQDMYDAANADGLTVIAVTVTPFKNHVNWTTDRQGVLDSVNAWIRAQPTNVDYVVDAYSALEDPSAADTLLAAYDSGDHLHPSVAGSTALAASIYANATWPAPPVTSWDLSAITGGSGDCGGNGNITFTTSATQYWKHGASATDYWTTTGNWYLGTNGTGGAGRMPLPQDDVVFDASSFPAGGKTIVSNRSRIGRSVTFAAVANSPTVTTSTAANVYGSLTLAPAANWTFTASTEAYTFEGRGSYTLTTNGNTWAKNLTLNAPGGTLTLADWPTRGAANTFTITNGELRGTYKIFVPAENTSFTLAGGRLTLYNCNFYRAVAAGTLISETSGTLNLRNCIFYNITDVLSSTGGTNTISNNDYYNSSNEGGTGSITSDPLWVTPGSDWHLQADSDCINAGVDVGLTTDYYGAIVPMGTAPEIGIDEYEQSGQSTKNPKDDKTGGK